jgi:hypothetical protein
MTSIVTVGYQQADLVVEGRAVRRLGDTLSREGLADLVDLTRDAITAGRHVLVVYPAWSAEPTRARIQIVRSSLETTRLVGYATSATPLAGAVLASLTDALVRYLPSAGLLLAALPLLERQLIAVTWLARVCGLADPAPTVWQHLASWWPQSAFVATSWPWPAVRQIGGPGDFVDLPRARAPIGLAVASRNGDEGWVQRCVIPQLGLKPRIHEVAPSPLGPRRWGCKRLVEVVVYPLDIESTAEALTRTLRVRRCGECREEIATEMCLLCGAGAAARELVSVGG